MAGGEGSRLRPITANRPKPLVPIVNRPIMEHIVELVRKHGISEVVATLHYLADEIQHYFGDGSDFGVQMHYSIEDTPLGTAGSVKQAEELLQDDSFLIISGDALTDCDLTKAIEFHKAKGALATLVLYRVANPLEFGIVITKEDGRISRFLEKPDWSEVFSDTVNTGIYILEPEIFQEMELGQNYDWSKDLFPALLAKGAPLYGYVMDGYWCDIGTLEQYREAHQDVLSGRTSLRIPGEEVAPGIWVDTNSVIDDRATLIAPICIGRNSRIKRGSEIGPLTVIGDSSLIEEGATVERAVLWDSSYIGMDVEVHQATIGSRVTLKREVKVLEDAVVGDRCLLDVGCTVRPRVKIWPDKTIERGSTVTMSLAHGNRWRGSLFRELGVAGLSNIEMTPEFATRFGLAYGGLLPQGSRIVVSRDSARSSRMLKGSLMSALLSSGQQVIDLHGLPVPIVRHHVRAIEADGAMGVRKLPGNSRLSLIETFDRTGSYLPRTVERKVESAFFREEFHRIDPDELPMIQESHGAVDWYQKDFFEKLPVRESGRRLRIVVDYGYSSISPLFPQILSRLNIEAITLNSFNDAKLAPRSVEENIEHLARLGHIVSSVGYDLGVLFTNEGENLIIVDDQGRPVVGNALFATLCLLVASTHASSKIVMSITAPSRLESFLAERSMSVVRCRSSVRDLMSMAQEEGVTFAGNESGGFIFPEFHPGFDAMFCLANLTGMLLRSGGTLSEIVAQIPDFHLAYKKVECPWDAKGMVMRRLSEESRVGSRVELVDGIKIYDDDAWVLILPDSFEPLFHVFAESPELKASEALANEYVERIELLRGIVE